MREEGGGGLRRPPRGRHHSLGSLASVLVLLAATAAAAGGAAAGGAAAGGRGADGSHGSHSSLLAPRPSEQQQEQQQLVPRQLAWGVMGRRRRDDAAAAAAAAGGVGWCAAVRGGAGSRRRKDEADEDEAESEAEEDESLEEAKEARAAAAAARRGKRQQASSRQMPYDGLGGSEEAVRRAKVELAVEDHNGLLKLEGGAVFGPKAGHFIVMPMTELLDPPLGSVLHDKLQYSDKVMLPKSFIYEVLSRKFEPPWHFEVEPLDEQYTGSADPDRSEELRQWRAKRAVPRLHCSNFDFRAPENYIFLPDWMFKALRLRPRDVVSLKFVRLPEGGLVAFQPHTAAFEKLANAHAVLESELKYYSCVTKGTTIRFKHNGKEHHLDVVETLGPKDVPVSAIRVQDTDIRTDIRPSKEEEARRKREEEAKKKAAAAAAAAEED